MQGFDYESINFKADVNMFEQMEIVESMYEGLVEPSYKKATKGDANCAGHLRKMGRDSASSSTYY